MMEGGTELAERLEEALRSFHWQRAPDGTWVRPPDHPNQLLRVRRDPRPAGAICEHVLAAPWFGGAALREELRRLVVAHLVDYGWQPEGKRLRAPDGRLQQAQTALRWALEH